MDIRNSILSRVSFSHETWEKLANPVSFSIIFAGEGFLFFLLYFWKNLGLGTLWVLFMMALLPCAVLMLSKKPHTTKRFVSQAVFGLRVWLDDEDNRIPKRHNGMIHSMLYGGLAIIPFMLYALIAGRFMFFVALMVLSIVLKLWACDKFFSIYSEMKKVETYYQEWLY